MNFFDVNSQAGDPSFTRRLVESAAVAAARGSGTSPAAAINAMRLPAIALDQHGFVAEVNAAEAVFDNDFRIKDRRLFVRDPDARARLKDAIDQLKTLPRHNPSVIEPIIVQRQDKLPVLVCVHKPTEVPHEGATALCRDGLYSYATRGPDICANHGGIAELLR